METLFSEVANRNGHLCPVHILPRRNLKINYLVYTKISSFADKEEWRHLVVLAGGVVAHDGANELFRNGRR